uniref:Transmembrane protein 144 n=1 Tax=Setaria digitata TaxID=48799 RepID=A0A915Q0V4_9BILA
MGNTLTGLAACGVSTFLYGSLFVPVKQFDPGDGFFSQWVMDTAIFMVGMIINAYKGFPKFYPLAMLGGIFWGIGNATAIPILQSIGMGMALLIWGTASCLMGWASSRFGLFGLKKNVPNNATLNYAGLLLILAGGILFALLKPTPKTVRNKEEENEEAIDLGSSTLPLKSSDKKYGRKKLFKHNQKGNEHTTQKRIFGVVLSLLAGLFYGLTFAPFDDAPPDALPYVFAHFTGILITGTVILIGYTIIKLNRPVVNQQIILPAFISGIMWAIAQTSWFIANNYIAQSISFPINSMVPGVIGALWSVIYFKEISGTRNLKILFVAVITTITGAVMIGLSKDL